MNWQNIIDGFINGVVRILIGRPTYRPKPVPPVPSPMPSPVPPPTPVGPPPTPDPATLAGDLFAAINAARTAYGLPRFVNDPLVSAVSAAWAKRMAMAGTLTHGDFANRIATVRPGVAAGETIGEGYPDATSEVRGWLNDPPHRAILLGNYSAVGVGVEIAGDGTIYWVADFLLE